jgi:UDP-2,3-diacylglucosamine hydrolase
MTGGGARASAGGPARDPEGNRSPVGLIAARGLLPVEIAAGARRLGRQVVSVNIYDADPRLPDMSDAYYTVAVGELGAMIAAFRRHGVREVLLAGKVDKLTVLQTSRFDADAQRVARRSADFGDASILAGLITVLEDAGFEVGSQARYISHLVPAEGVLSRRAPSPDEDRDIRLGARIATGIAGLDVGQSVAVRGGVVVAVEAAEGTDAMIRRAGELATGLVVVKVSRPRQDPRYDLPVVGPQTVDALARAGGAALAVEAERTILLERARLIAAADAAGIAVVAVRPVSAG